MTLYTHSPQGELAPIIRIHEAAAKAGRSQQMARKILLKTCKPVYGSPKREPFFWEAEALSALQNTPACGSGRPKATLPKMTKNLVFMASYIEVLP